MLIYCQKKWNTIVFHNIKRTPEMNIPKLFFGGDILSDHQSGSLTFV